MKKRVPKSLRVWFIVHFIIDMIFGIPLIIAPKFILNLIGFQTLELLTARIVGAALIAIGGTSLLMHEKKSDSFNTMLTLKIIWSLAAILGIILTLIEGAPLITWLILIIFGIFSITWIYYKLKS